MNLYPSAPATIKHRSTVVAYCDATVESEFDYKATKNGYITLNQKRLIETAAPMSVSFYDSKGKKITDVVSDHEIATKIMFPVKKGESYKIREKTLSVDGQQFYQMNLTFTALNEKSGSNKGNAVNIKLKKHTLGMIYTQDSIKKTDWYKFTNSKNRKIKFTYAGGVTSGSINVSIYNSKGKKMGTYYLMPTKGDPVTYKLTNVNKSQTIAKGTYYVKVTKSRKETAGVYDLKFY